MNFLLILISCLALVDGNEQWTNFKMTYGKFYENIEEELHRKTVFEKNLMYIENHNELFDRGLVTFDVKMNAFGDLTVDEFKSRMHNHPVSERRDTNMLIKTRKYQNEDQVDWREKGAVTPVKDQGMMGASWAFSAVGSLEGIWFLKTGDLVPLSEQQLQDCVEYNNPSWMNFAFEYIKENGGIDCADAYTFTGGECNFNPLGVCANDTGYVAIPVGDESAQADAVRKVGPISVSLDAGHISFQFYSSGVYYEPECEPMLNHALVAVGYGSETGSDYWILKNSWGASWGESGYVRTARNKDNNCGIATDSSYPTV